MGILKRFLEEYICFCITSREVNVPLYDDEDEESEPLKKHRIVGMNGTCNSVASDASDISSSHSPWYLDPNNLVDIPPPLNKGQLEELRAKLREIIYEDERKEFLINSIKKLNDTNGITCRQLDILLHDIHFSSLKQECIEKLLPYITDIANEKHREMYLLKHIDYQSDKQLLREKITQLLQSRRKG